ncbi:hypothetical protein JZ751_012221, partial [Albula glossodonta]
MHSPSENRIENSVDPPPERKITQTAVISDQTFNERDDRPTAKIGLSLCTGSAVAVTEELATDLVSKMEAGEAKDPALGTSGGLLSAPIDYSSMRARAGGGDRIGRGRGERLCHHSDKETEGKE